MKGFPMKQGRIQSRFEGGAVGSGALKIFQKLVTRVHCIQQFEVHFRKKQVVIFLS